MTNTEHLPTTHEHDCAMCRAEITCENEPWDCPSICLNCVDDEALRKIEKAQRACNVALSDLRRAVAEARAVDVSWTRIGAELGISKQAAQQRFSSPSL
jgi:hypothetical protein